MSEPEGSEGSVEPLPSPHHALDDSWIQRFRAIAQSSKRNSAATLERAVRFRELYAEFEAVAADTARALVACLCLSRDPRDPRNLSPSQTRLHLLSLLFLCVKNKELCHNSRRMKNTVQHPNRSTCKSESEIVPGAKDGDGAVCGGRDSVQV